MNRTDRRTLSLVSADERYAIARAHAQTDAAMTDLTRQAAALGITIACQRGCAACCTYAVAAFAPEVAAITDAIQAQPRAVREATISRLVAWCRAWAAHSKGKVATGHVALSWQVKRVACPLLDPTSLDCAVYAQRPSVCRSHHAAIIPDTDRVEADHRYRECGCGVGDPPGDCFTSPQAAEHGHHNTIWQVSHTSDEEGVQRMVSALEMTGAQTVEAGVLPELVLADGSTRFGWSTPAKTVPLTVLRTATRTR